MAQISWAAFRVVEPSCIPATSRQIQVALLVLRIVGDADSIRPPRLTQLHRWYCGGYEVGSLLVPGYPDQVDVMGVLDLDLT